MRKTVNGVLWHVSLIQNTFLSRTGYHLGVRIWACIFGNPRTGRRCRRPRRCRVRTWNCRFGGDDAGVHLLCAKNFGMCGVLKSQSVTAGCLKFKFVFVNSLLKNNAISVTQRASAESEIFATQRFLPNLQCRATSNMKIYFYQNIIILTW